MSKDSHGKRRTYTKFNHLINHYLVTDAKVDYFLKEREREIRKWRRLVALNPDDKDAAEWLRLVKSKPTDRGEVRERLRDIEKRAIDFMRDQLRMTDDEIEKFLFGDHDDRVKAANEKRRLARIERYL
jgi:hypothetical protein